MSAKTYIQIGLSLVPARYKNIRMNGRIVEIAIAKRGADVFIECPEVLWTIRPRHYVYYSEREAINQFKSIINK